MGDLAMRSPISFFNSQFIVHGASHLLMLIKRKIENKSAICCTSPKFFFNLQLI